MTLTSIEDAEKKIAELNARLEDAHKINNKLLEQLDAIRSASRVNPIRGLPRLTAPPLEQWTPDEMRDVLRELHKLLKFTTCWTITVE